MTTKTHTIRALKQWVCRAGLFGSVGFLLVTIVAPAAVFAAGAISQGYKTTSTNVSKGTLLSLVSSGSTTVEPANSTTNVAKLVGIAADKPLVELSNGAASDTRVVVSGSTEALVSDMNGTVNAGDKITASPVSGIGMKSVQAAEVVGTAQASLSSVSLVNQTVTGTDGKTQTIKVGLLPIAVNVTYYSAATQQGIVAAFVPPFLQSLANGIAGRQVSPLRVLLAAIALLLGFGAVTVMLYTSIRSGVISIGRNPLAQAALRKSLVDVVVAAIGLLVITTVIVYVALII